MKNIAAKTLAFITLLFLVAATPAQSASELNGKWSMKKKTDFGEVTQQLEFKDESFTFRIINSEGNTAFFARGKVKLEKLGSFKAMKLSDIQWGESESDLQSSEDERNIIYSIRYSNLILAGNFDKERDNEEPSADSYSKVSK